MSNYEFTRLADVPVVETVNDTTNVLVEENGEIKKVAKNQVGGAGAGKPVVFWLASQRLCKDMEGAIPASVEEIVDAYFAGTAHVWQYEHAHYIPEKIIGFGISGVQPYLKYATGGTSGAMGSMSLYGFDMDEFTEAVDAYLAQ